MDELLKKYALNEVNILQLEKSMTEAITELKSAQEQLKQANEQIKEQIMASMKNNDIKKYENDYIAITYTAPYSKETLDTAKLKEEYSNIYEKCLKKTNVKESLRIKVKHFTAEIIQKPGEELTL